MPKPIVAGTIDPLATFLERRRRDRRPVPLAATSIEVDIEGGVGVVSTRRLFRNLEYRSIEAALTFPVPVHATLFGLEARIGERRLLASARRREQAREDYEAAVDAGLTAVLHEELLRGLHMLSVGPLAPNAEIAVMARWVSTLAFVGAQGQLRIPMTVGEIYGRAPLPDTDDLVTGGEPAIADLVVRADRPVTLTGGALVEGRARVRTDAPIDLAVSAATPRAVAGVTAEGGAIAMTVSPTTRPSVGSLDLAILIDRSGSMDFQENGGGGEQTKHQAAIAALARLAPKLTGSDRLDLWEFDTSVAHLGEARAAEAGAQGATLRDQFRRLVGLLGDPRGGTEIGAAVSQVIGRTAARDLLLITDGLSHALDAQALAGNGTRISVLLVGEDSLEANVGHLAALTGGDLIVASGADMGASLEAALVGLRMPFGATEADGRGRRLHATRRGGDIVVDETDQAPFPAEGPIGRAVGALAASLRLPTLPADQAAVLAEREGIVTHLTSLVLVDQAAEAVDGLPALRKVALPNPRTAGPVEAQERASLCILEPDRSVVTARLEEIEAKALQKLRHPMRPRKLREFLDVAPGDSARPPAPDTPSGLRGTAAPSPREELQALAAQIAWGDASDRLVGTDLSGVPAEIAKALLRFAARDDIVVVANRLGLDPLLMTIGCVARLAADTNRSADRVARFIFSGIEPDTLDRTLDELGKAHHPIPSGA